MHSAVCWNIRFLLKIEPNKGSRSEHLALRAKECRDLMVLDYSITNRQHKLLLKLKHKIADNQQGSPLLSVCYEQLRERTLIMTPQRLHAEYLREILDKDIV